MEYKLVPCEVITQFETYEECANYMMKNNTESEGSQNKGYPFEKYFVKILREHPVLYDEKHRKFGRKFPTKHAWSIVAGYMMMKRKEVQEAWATFQKLANSGVQLYVDLVNYVKLGNGIGWIDADSDSENEGDSAVKEEDDGSSSVNMDDSIRVKEEVVSTVKTEMDE